MMPLSITYDHRLVDGAAAARFTNEIKSFLAAPGRLLLAPNFLPTASPLQRAVLQLHYCFSACSGKHSTGIAIDATPNIQRKSSSSTLSSAVGGW